MQALLGECSRDCGLGGVELCGGAGGVRKCMACSEVLSLQWPSNSLWLNSSDVH